MSLKLTILGCGSSGGVPRIGNIWGACDPSDPRNRRRRCSVLLRKTAGADTTTVLIDTSPDLREQLLDAEVAKLDGVLFTHEHADHTHGIDELRAVALNMRRRVDVWADDRTSSMLTTRFSYCFAQPPGSDYPPIVSLHRIEARKPVEIKGAAGGIAAMPFELEHGTIRALGFRIGDTAYTPDLNGVPEESLEALQGLDLWIVDALRLTRHPSHLSLAETLEWIDRLRPKKAVVTNLHIDLDYETLRRELPAHVQPAYDGLTLAIS